MSKDINLDTFTVGLESLDDTNGLESLNVIGAIDTDIDTIIGAENFNLSNSLSDRRTKLISNIQNCDSSESSDDFFKPNVVVHGNEYHLFLNETYLIFSEYLKRLFKFIANLDENKVVKVFFFYYPWPSIANDFTLVASIIGAFHASPAKTVACVYNQIRFVPSLVALACDEMVIGDFGSMLLEYPDLSTWGEHKVYRTIINQAYDRFLTRGIITKEEYETIIEDHSKFIYLDSKTLKERV